MSISFKIHRKYPDIIIPELWGFVIDEPQMKRNEVVYLYHTNYGYAFISNYVLQVSYRPFFFYTTPENLTWRVPTEEIFQRLNQHAQNVENLEKLWSTTI